MALAGGNADMVFTLRQEGGALTGSLNPRAAVASAWRRSGRPVQDGRVDGANVSFRVG
jgi:hypothetical protein